MFGVDNVSSWKLFGHHSPVQFILSILLVALYNPNPSQIQHHTTPMNINSVHDIILSICICVCIYKYDV